MQELEYRMAAIREREAHLRSIRIHEREAGLQAYSIRRQLGESIIRLGRRVAGNQPASPASPAWTS
jgi:hypothetical protein